MEEIKLKYPIKVDGIEIKSLKMRRPKVRDRMAVEKQSASDAEKEVNLIANLCEVSPDALSELDLADYKLLQDKITDFLS